MFIENKEFKHNYSTNKFLYKLVDDSYFDVDGIIKPNYKFSITPPAFKIKDSRVIGNPDDKFETILFLPKGEGRKGENGLRAKRYFKFSYKLKDEVWYICDITGNPIKPAPDEIGQAIRQYLNNLPSSQQEVWHQVEKTKKRSFFTSKSNNLHDNEKTTLSSDQITKLPLITVITVVLNGEKYLEETIQSVINQTYPNVEYIIIDGGSNDGTLDIIKKYEDSIDYWVSEKDNGIYDAMNKGVILANGKWINFMNAGDTFYNENILAQVFLVDIINNCDIIYGDVVIVFDNFTIYRKAEDLEKIIYRIPFNHQSTFFRSSIIKKNLFKDTFKIAGDFELLLRLYLKGVKFCYVNRYITNFKPEGISAKQGVLAMQEAYIAKKVNNVCTLKNKIYSFFDILIEVIKSICFKTMPIGLINLYRKIRYKTEK